MPNSGTVTAGSVALASQYNNLRADVLDASTGHVHDGTTDGGKQIEGTVLKSTGATAGHVLTAGAGGTATTWAAVTSDTGTFATATLTANFSSANDFTTVYPYNLGTAVTVLVGIGNAGSAVVISGSADQQRTTLPFQTFTVGAHTANATATSIATASIGVYTTGTAAGYAVCVLDGSRASNTAIYWTEVVTQASNRSVAFRKYKTDLTGSIFNAVLKTASSHQVRELNVFDGIRAKFVPELNVWLGAVTDTGTTPGTAIVWLVNDTSGSVYSQTFATTPSGSSLYDAVRTVYVPPSGAGNGTVYGVSIQTGSPNTRLVVAYTASSAALTIAGTPISNTSSYNFAGTSLTSLPDQLWWDSDLGHVVWTSSQNMYAIDRTFATATFMGSAVSGVSIGGMHTRVGDYLAGGDVTFPGGSATSTYVPNAALLPKSASAYSLIIAPGGTPTAWMPIRNDRFAGFVISTDANLVSRSMNSFRQATTTMTPTAFGRMIWNADSPFTIVNKFNATDNRITMDGGLSFLPANGTVGVTATNSTATGTVTQNIYTLRMK